MPLTIRFHTTCACLQNVQGYLWSPWKTSEDNIHRLSIGTVNHGQNRQLTESMKQAQSREWTIMSMQYMYLLNVDARH